MSPLQNVVSQMIPTLRGRGYPNGRHMQGSRFVLLYINHIDGDRRMSSIPLPMILSNFGLLPTMKCDWSSNSN